MRIGTRRCLNRTDSLQRRASNALNQNDASPSRVNQMLAIRTVLESPELLRSIFDYCNMETLIRLNLVNRSFKAASAPKIYRNVDLTMDDRSTLTTCRGTPTSRQIRNISYARAAWIEFEMIHHDLSPCSVAGVEVLEFRAPVYLTEDGLFDGYGNDDDDDADLVYRSHQIARNLAKCPDVNSSTVVDDKLLTAPIKPGDSMRGIAPEGITDHLNLINNHTTRLVTYNSSSYSATRWKRHLSIQQAQGSRSYTPSILN